MRRRTLLCLLLLVAPRIPAQTTKEAFATLYAAVDSYMDKAKVHQRFTYTMLKDTTIRTPEGKVRGHLTEKFEQMYIGGLPYVRLLEQNGKPLSGKAEKKEQERYDQAVKDSSGMSMEKWIKLRYGKGFGYDLPLEDLKSKFATQFIGPDLVAGKMLLRFHLSTVQTSMNQPNPVVPEEATLWIDFETKSLVKSSYTLWADSDDLLEGTTGTEEYFLIDGTLCEQHYAAHYVIKNFGQTLFLDGDTTYADYKKFTSTVKILPDTETLVPPTP